MDERGKVESAVKSGELENLGSVTVLRVKRKRDDEAVGQLLVQVECSHSAKRKSVKNLTKQLEKASLHDYSK